MIHNLYIIGDNGICVYYKKYGSLNEDPQSISGFLTAISLFSKSVIGEGIKTLVTDNFKFIFKSDNKFTFVVFTNNSDCFEDMQTFLENIEIEFYHQFPNAAIEYKGGNLSHFKTFNLPENSITTFHKHDDQMIISIDN